MNVEKIPGIWFALSGVVYLIGLPVCFLVAPHELRVGICEWRRP